MHSHQASLRSTKNIFHCQAQRNLLFGPFHLIKLSLDSRTLLFKTILYRLSILDLQQITREKRTQIFLFFSSPPTEASGAHCDNRYSTFVLCCCCFVKLNSVLMKMASALLSAKNKTLLLLRLVLKLKIILKAFPSESECLFINHKKAFVVAKKKERRGWKSL